MNPPNKRYGKLKKGKIVRLVETQNSVELIHKRFLMPNIIENINLSEFCFYQNHFNIILTNENKTKSFILNRTYHKYLNELSSKYKILIASKKEINISKSAGLLQKIKDLFYKSDIEKLKTIAK